METETIRPGDYGMSDPQGLLRYSARCLCREKPDSDMARFWSKVFWRCVCAINAESGKCSVWKKGARPERMSGTASLGLENIQDAVDGLSDVGLRLAAAGFVMPLQKKGLSPRDIAGMLESSAVVD